MRPRSIIIELFFHERQVGGLTGAAIFPALDCPCVGDGKLRNVTSAHKPRPTLCVHDPPPSLRALAFSCWFFSSPSCSRFFQRPPSPCDIFPPFSTRSPPRRRTTVYATAAPQYARSRVARTHVVVYRRRRRPSPISRVGRRRTSAHSIPSSRVPHERIPRQHPFSPPPSPSCRKGKKTFTRRNSPNRRKDTMVSNDARNGPPGVVGGWRAFRARVN